MVVVGLLAGGPGEPSARRASGPIVHELPAAQLVGQRDLAQDDRDEHEHRGDGVEQQEDDEPEADPGLQHVQDLVLDADGHGDDEQGRARSAST